MILICMMYLLYLLVFTNLLFNLGATVFKFSSCFFLAIFDDKASYSVPEDAVVVYVN